MAMSIEAVEQEPVSQTGVERPVLRFLGRTEVAHYLGMRSIRSLAGVELPPHDAEIGDRKGWFPASIDAWQARRPGKGRHGSRLGHTRAGAAVNGVKQ
jgi:predicted DNA-binding transcriptional regulator AlpA